MKDIQGKTIRDYEKTLDNFRAKTVYIPKKKREQMSGIKKFFVKRALPYFIESIDLEVDVDKDEAINVVTYRVKVKLFGQTILHKEKAEKIV